MAVRRSTAQARRPSVDWGVAGVWTLLLSPLALVPGGLFRFSLPELTVAALGALLAVLAPAAGRLPRSVVALLGAATILLLLAATTSAAPVAQLVGRWPRYEGLVALPVYAGTLWAGARLLGPGATAASRRALGNAASASALAIAAVAVAEATGLRPLGGDVARTGGLLGNASDQGIVAAMLLAILLPALPSARRALCGSHRPAAAEQIGAVLTCLGALAAASALLLSGSRGALAAAAVATAVQVLAGARRARSTARAVMVGAAVLAVLAIGAIATPQMSARLFATGGPAASSADGRVLLWSATTRVIAQHPWTGVGPSGLVDALPDEQTEEWALTSDAAHAPVSAHSWVLQAAAAGGIPLLALALALAVAVAVHARRRLSEPLTDCAAGHPVPLAALGAVVAGAVALAVHPTGSATVVVAAAMTGSLVARPAPRTRLGRTARTFSVALAGLWVVGLALGSAAEIPLARVAAHAAAGDVPGAESALRVTTLLRPWDPSLDLLAAEIYVAGSNAGHLPSATAARHHAELALDRTPRSLEAARIGATALITLDRPEQARQELTHLLARSPFDARLLLARGVASATLTDWASAERDLIAASRYAPSDAVVWQNLAHLYAVTDRTALARDAADRATSLAP